MKAQRNFPRLIITAKGTQWVEQGHPWIYEGEVIRTAKTAASWTLSVRKASIWVQAF